MGSSTRSLYCEDPQANHQSALDPLSAFKETQQTKDNLPPHQRLLSDEELALTNKKPQLPTNKTLSSISGPSSTGIHGHHIPDTDPCFIAELWDAVLRDMDTAPLSTQDLTTITNSPHAFGIPSDISDINYETLRTTILFPDDPLGSNTNEQRYATYQEQFPHLHVWLDPASSAEILPALKAIFSTTVADMKAYAFEVLFRAGESYIQDQSSGIRRVAEETLKFGPKRAGSGHVVSNDADRMVQPPKILGHQIPPVSGRLSRAVTSVFSPSKKKHASSANINTQADGIRIFCVYYLAHISNKPFAFQRNLPTWTPKDPRFTPYLSIYVDREPDNFYTMDELKIASTVMVYNQWLLRERAAKKKNFHDNAHQLPLCHWSIKISSFDWGLYVTRPSSMKEWKGSKVQEVYCRRLELQTLQFLMATINDIHFWALTKYTPACKELIGAMMGTDL
ncbi:hypothetical protein BU26DRAFT_524997 [Trematosphaeria pertusa]|uniref:Uncharacterized protein n=1 Tax=Trematosphaeria pertusa TaxID=390896 RepID=A0A6A6HV23_9PLEO|nr:uncharacterized protein BU26DRAFT_524997 [Trematosphaeria pertusa]KAF2241877.1 hypothetical protein BU26DRAFT_524997 [Trematosphaeria pertusa]